ncbi:uncharacterized protein LOC114258152 [Camellia sinensis]|uniref:uncharacterized protein LOC114258152 n=1 Tax=Camellia sinensis TaxID=4442 RepID=UPI0010361422|nr:uncharacterized protein LOC114258152 [Camellia sinensis]
MRGSKACEIPLKPGLKLSEDQGSEPVDRGRYQRLMGKGLYFSKHGHLSVEAYTDADWVGSVTDRRSISGYCTFVGGNLVTWRSKKQNVVVRSSAEAEFRVMTQGVCELLWIRLFLWDLGIH